MGVGTGAGVGVGVGEGVDVGVGVPVGWSWGSSVGIVGGADGGGSPRQARPGDCQRCKGMLYLRVTWLRA